MKIEFYNNQYVLSHGKNPSGRGVWAFEILGCKKLGVFFSPSMTLGDAKKWMREQIKAMDIPATVAVVNVDVLP